MKEPIGSPIPIKEKTDWFDDIAQIKVKTIEFHYIARKGKKNKSWLIFQYL